MTNTLILTHKDSILDENDFTTNPLYLKHNDSILDGTELIPLISNIDDTEGVLIEHLELNKSSRKLEFALVYHKGDYYFIDCKNSIREDVYITDGKNYICPKCRKELALVSGFTRKNKKVDSYLRHIASDVECDFKSFYNSKEVDDYKNKKHTGEGDIHKRLKLSTLRTIIDKGIKLKIPTSYTLNIIDNKPLVNFKYKEIFINNAEVEKVALKGDETTKGYRPDITAQTSTGETIYIEITNKTGKRVKEYYDIWRRMNKTVIEVRYCDNIDDNIHYHDYYNKEDYYDDLILDDKIFRILYNPIIHKARAAKLQRLKYIADEKRRTQQKNFLKRLVNKELLEINKDAKARNIKKMPVVDIKFKDGSYIYIGYNNLQYPSYWYKIFFNGETIHRKLPKKIYEELKNRCSYLTIKLNQPITK